MSPAEAQLIATALNGAFTLLAAWRRREITEAELKTRLDAVDAGGPAVTADEIMAAEDAFRRKIDEGRAMP